MDWFYLTSLLFIIIKDRLATLTAIQRHYRNNYFYADNCRVQFETCIASN